ncbi:restriction endonuclease, partial [bacterium]|nr:restriction endonuclease [bacterium]
VKEWFANIESGVVDISDMKKDSVGRVTSKTVKKLNVKEFKKVTEQLIGKLGYKSGKFMKSVGKDELFYYAKEKKMFGKQIIVTFKRWNSPIGELAIEDFCQILAEEKLKKGVLISNSEINDDARKLAAKSGIMTVDDVGIDKLLSI